MTEHGRDIGLQDIRHRLTENQEAPRDESTEDVGNLKPESNWAPKREVVEALNYYPDGGWYAWFQVFCCCCLFGTTTGSIYSWGVIQDALVTANFSNSATLSMVGSTQVVLESILGLVFARMVTLYGPARVSLVGSAFTAAGPILCGFFTRKIPVLFIGQGLVYGTGQAMIFWSTSPLASSYFLRKRNLATGIVYAGGPFGAAILSVVASKLVSAYGVEWTFRILGCIYAAINFPASWFLESRLPRGKDVPRPKVVEWSLFKDMCFVLLMVGTALSMFQLFVPAFFLPLYGTAIGLSTSTSSMLLLAYNLASAAGRIFFGLTGDKLIGSVNSLLICLFVGGIVCATFWPFARTFPPLLVFSLIGGATTGGFFSLMPGVISALFGSSKLHLVLSMIIFTWTPGYFMGSAIAGYILEASGGAKDPNAYRPAMYYAGSVSITAALLIYGARLYHSPGIFKRL